MLECLEQVVDNVEAMGGTVDMSGFDQLEAVFFEAPEGMVWTASGDRKSSVACMVKCNGLWDSWEEACADFLVDFHRGFTPAKETSQ